MNNQLLAVIKSYLQKNIQENKDIEEGGFSYAAAKAALAGKDKFKFGGKEHPVKMSKKKAQDIVNEIESNLQEKNVNNEAAKASDVYTGTGRSKKQNKAFDAEVKKVQNAEKKGKKLSAAEYEAIEKRRRGEGSSGVKSPLSQKDESLTLEELQFLLNEVYEEILDEKKKRRKKRKTKKKSKKKKKSASKTLSKKTKETLRKKARAKGYTPGSVYSEYRKGLGAYYTSGSRKGMGAHQWAMARVNSALQGGKSWATVKKSKAKKK